jgi:hypothetical protein
MFRYLGQGAANPFRDAGQSLHPVRGLVGVGLRGKVDGVHGFRKLLALRSLRIGLCQESVVQVQNKFYNELVEIHSVYAKGLHIRKGYKEVPNFKRKEAAFFSIGKSETVPHHFCYRRVASWVLDRVTDWANFRPMGDCLHWAVFSITKVALLFGLLFPQ